MTRVRVETSNIDRGPASQITQEKNSNMESAETQQKHLEKHIEIETCYVLSARFRRNMESAETLPIIVDNADAEIVKPTTSKGTKQDMKSSKDSPRKKKLRLKIAKLKVQNKTLREIIRRLRLKEKKKNIQTEEANEHETLKKLSHEMSLKSFLFYDISRDEIIGFEDFGDRETSVPAKSALVIMARSIAGNWKLPE
ncbi:PREDICTED: uncharacterized protein LOC108759113 [Trachymyrmex cornetzi]|uniref:uncharacterized protein LOC108759113 n=1 Tax=Trachymyrmex cornetzi TaxID=471704 RepID=UPI00084F56E0|nr:PREDICTED: uncharacterized protein LOC108759113 [Trachymyrmex cornetzi]